MIQIFSLIMSLALRLKNLADQAFKHFVLIAVLIRDLTVAWMGEVYKFWTARHKSVVDNVIVITGGAGAIGKAVAYQLAKRGAKIVLIDLNQKSIDETVAHIKENIGVKAVGFCCDCTKLPNLLNVVKSLESNEDFGPVDILISCAGSLRAKTLLDLTENDVRLSFDVNVISIFWAIKAFLPQMIKRNKGQIVAISSVAAHFGQSSSSAYSASKYAIRGLMESLMWELSDLNKTGIKTTMIYPYFTKTPLLDEVSPSSRFFDTLPLDYTASEIVNNVLYETEEAFVPHILGIFCLFIKQMSPGKVKAVWRDFFNVVYVDPTSSSAQNSPSKASTPNSSQAKLTTSSETKNGDVTSLGESLSSSPSVAAVVEKLVNGIDERAAENFAASLLSPEAGGKFGFNVALNGGGEAQKISNPKKFSDLVDGSPNGMIIDEKY